MPRVKLSEYRAKLIYDPNYQGLEVNLDLPKNTIDLTARLDTNQNYVVKVDQAVKKRGKLGLIGINLTIKQSIDKLCELKAQGYNFALVEPYLGGDGTTEHYISLQITDDGVDLKYSDKGGMDIENHTDSVHSIKVGQLPMKLQPFASHLLEIFDSANMTYLEINPFTVDKKGNIKVLDMAVEVDSVTAYKMGELWGEKDVRNPKGQHMAEVNVANLAKNSPASFSLRVLNPQGSISMLLSGGGASIVIADELANQGLADKIVNYGEYSGNPSALETELYTDQILSLIKQSKSSPKVLIIGGGVANFTDIKATFTGIINSMIRHTKMMQAANITVLIRRGGPNQVEGLRIIDDFLSSINIDHSVWDGSHSLTMAASAAAKIINGKASS